MLRRIVLSATTFVVVVAPGLRADASPAPANVVESLTISEDRVRAGSVVHVTTPSCPTPSTIESISHRTLHPMTKGVPPYAPLDLGTISLEQDGSGVSFQYVPAEYRTWEEFELVCSDGTVNITSSPVAVFPPEGEAWWAYNTYDQNVFHADPGYVFFLGIRTIECEVGETASAGIEGYDTNWTFAAPAPADGRLEWDVDIPADIQQGHYFVTFSCPRTGGGYFTAQTFVVIGLPELDVLGSDTTVLHAAWGATLAGSVLLLVARRRSAAHTG